MTVTRGQDGFFQLTFASASKAKTARARDKTGRQCGLRCNVRCQQPIQRPSVVTLAPHSSIGTDTVIDAPLQERRGGPGAKPALKHPLIIHFAKTRHRVVD
jgi:hypothetical protein